MVQGNIEVDTSNTYGEYNSLNVAKMACLNDTQCMGVYEASCNKNGPFALFKNNFVTKLYGVNCIYKRIMYGKFILDCAIIRNYESL